MGHQHATTYHWYLSGHNDTESRPQGTGTGQNRYRPVHPAYLGGIEMQQPMLSPQNIGTNKTGRDPFLS